MSAMLGASVYAVGNHVGVVTDVYADESVAHVIGLEVTGLNARRWFLPWVATTFEDGTAQAMSPLVFIPAEQLDFYIERGVRLSEDGVGDILVRPDGRVARPSPADWAKGGAGVP